MNILSFVAGPKDDHTVGGLAYIDRLSGSIHQNQPANNVTLIICGRPPVSTPNFVTEGCLPSDENLFDGFQIITFPSIGKYGFSWKFIQAIPDILKTKTDFITLHSIYTFPVIIGYLIARFRKIPYAIWPHGVFSPYQRSISTFKKWVFDCLFTKRIFRNASVVVFTAKGEREEFRTLDIKVRSVIIPHGIDLEPYQNLSRKSVFRTRYFGDYVGPLILFLSRVNSKKGLDILLPVLKKLQDNNVDFRAAIVGAADPPVYGKKVKKWIDYYHLGEKVKMPGPLFGDYKLEAFADSDLFVLPSRSENFGYAVFEAMASRLPVLISDQINYAKEIEESHAGLCVRLNEDELYLGIKKFLSEPALRRKLAESGYVFVNKFPWANTGQKINEMIASIVELQPFPDELSPEIL